MTVAETKRGPLRILVASIPMPSDRFISDLNAHFSRSNTVVHDHERFWAMEGEFDVVHVHFPEYLTFEIERCMDTGLTDELLQALEQRLDHWKAHAAIVVTRHVYLPHRRKDAAFQRLYEIVYRCADAVVHFGQVSVQEFQQRYEDALAGVKQRHVVIPQHNYASLPNSVGRDEARKSLGIGRKAKVMLVFGGIQGEVETERILGAFRAAKVQPKVLLVSSWRERLRKVSWIRLKYWVRDLTRLYYRLHPRYCFHYGFVEDDRVQYFLNAADIVFIPRGEVLNSGNMILGFTFGKIVVGPDSGNVGEVLRANGNPVFDPSAPDSIPEAVNRGFELAREGLGERNREMALSHWSVNEMGERYLDLFRELCADPR